MNLNETIGFGDYVTYKTTSMGERMNGQKERFGRVTRILTGKDGKRKATVRWEEGFTSTVHTDKLKRVYNQ